jgi:hypothetical protein
MEVNAEGEYSWAWTWLTAAADEAEWADKYSRIVRQWNALVPLFNATVVKRNVGRPLLASEAQVIEVRMRRKRGESLRGIADEMNLSFTTVRTIVDQKAGTDRTSIKYLSRINPERAAMRKYRAKRQQRAALPKRINALLQSGSKLLKEAKGLGR